MITVTSVDRDELPIALLSLVKLQLRVDHAYDDTIIRSAIARAIGRLEANSGYTINPTRAVWTPATAEFNSTGATLPARPASNIFTAAAGTPPADVTANYSIALKWNDITGGPIQVLVGAFAAGLSVTLSLGYSEETLPAELLDCILRNSAHLYEHREILLDSAAYVLPAQENDATWWYPRL
jgi:uncharacterized phiE125 gp8 family phage protein